MGKALSETVASRLRSLGVYGAVVGIAMFGTGLGQAAPLTSRIAALLVVCVIFLPALAFVVEVAARWPRLPRLALSPIAGVATVGWALILVTTAVLARTVGISLADVGPALVITGAAGAAFALFGFDARTPRPSRWWRSMAIGVAALDLSLAAVVAWGGPPSALAP